MKKFKFLVLPLLTGGILLFTLKAIAADISIGGAITYNFWEPVWNNGKIVSTQNGIKVVLPNGPQFHCGETFLYGPIVSIRFFNKLEISSAFYYGEYDLKTAYYEPGYDFATPNLFRKNFIFKIKNYNINSIFGYHINRFFKLFTDFRAYIFDYAGDYKQIGLLTDSYSTFKIEISTRYYNTELGVGINIPIFRIFSILIDLSGIALIGYDTPKFKNNFDSSGSLSSLMIKIDKGKFYAYGGSSSLYMKLNIPGLSSALNLGFRYQILRFKQEKEDRSLYDIDGESDHNYGVNLSVTYNFSTKKNKKKKRVWIPRPSLYD